MVTRKWQMARLLVFLALSFLLRIYFVNLNWIKAHVSMVAISLKQIISYNGICHKNIM